jgi:hypothetical protein
MKISIIIDDGDTDLNRRVECREAPQPRHQPPSGEGTWRGDGQNAHPATSTHALAREQDAVEPGLHSIQESVSGICKLN